MLKGRELRKGTSDMTANAWIGLAALALACSGENFASSNGANLRGDGGAVDASSPASGGTSSQGGGSGSSGSSGTSGKKGAGGSTSGDGGAPSSGGVTGSGGTGIGGGAGGTGVTGGSSSSGGTPQTGGGSGVADAGTGNGGSAAKLCGPGGTFPTFARGCSSATNCALVQHETNCCGSMLIMGINHGEVTRFADAEKLCESQYPLCGCVSQGIQAEDGTTVPADMANTIVAECVNMTCRSKYGGKTFACGQKTCTDLQYCSVTIGGAAGTLPTYNCVPMGNCTSCACLPNSGSCTCLVASDGNTVTCKAP